MGVLDRTPSATRPRRLSAHAREGTWHCHLVTVRADGSSMSPSWPPASSPTNAKLFLHPSIDTRARRDHPVARSCPARSSCPPPAPSPPPRRGLLPPPRAWPRALARSPAPKAFFWFSRRCSSCAELLFLLPRIFDHKQKHRRKKSVPFMDSLVFSSTFRL